MLVYVETVQCCDWYCYAMLQFVETVQCTVSTAAHRNNYF